RLVDMGIENYLLASTVKGVLAQRLVRRLCRHCAGPHGNAEFWAEEVAKKEKASEVGGAPSIRRARGCAGFGSPGVSGRTTIAELLLVDAGIHRMIQKESSDAEIESAARSGGMSTMYESGIAKVWRGETTIEEVLQATRMVA